MKDPTILRGFTDRAEAEIARGLLEAEGIHAAISADDMGAEGPGLTFGRPVDLIVEAEDMERAHKLLDEAIANPDSDAGEDSTG